jgi:hypothetical protein
LQLSVCIGYKLAAQLVEKAASEGVFSVAGRLSKR